MELLEKNEEVIALYGLLRTQVNVAPMGEFIGLDFNAIDFVFDLYGIEDRRLKFELLLVCFEMEREARLKKA